MEIVIDFYDDFESFRTKASLSKTKAARRLILQSLRFYQAADDELKLQIVEVTESFLDRFRGLEDKGTKSVWSSLDRGIHKEVQSFIKDYNGRSQTIHSQKEGLAALVNLAIDPNKPWPND